jgi:hypothetical protein
MDARVKVVAFDINLEESKGYHQVEDTMQLVRLLVKAVVIR